MSQSEKQLCTAIVQYLNYQGCHVWRENAGVLSQTYKGKTRVVRLAKKGTSDIIGYRKRDGRFIALEVKLPSRRKRVTEAQELFLVDVKMGNGIAGVVTSPEEALAIVEAHD